MDLSNDLSCEAGSLSCCLNPPQVFSPRGLKLYFPALEPWVMWFALLPCCLSGLSVCECGAAGSTSGQTACPVPPTLRQSPSRHGHASPLRPGARLHLSFWSECMFLFYLLGVGLPCHWIFCQFWLCEEAQCVYLHCHLGSPVARNLNQLRSESIGRL